MEDAEACPGCDAGDLAGTVALADVQAELDQLEAAEREIDTLTKALRATLAPEQFRLAWALKDAEERRGLAECGLAERRVLDRLARHLPAHGREIWAAGRHLITGEPLRGSSERP